MIRNIYHMCQLVPATGAWFTFPTAVDPVKSIIMLQGEGYRADGDYDGSNFYAWAWQCPAVYNSMNSSSVFVDFSELPIAAVNIALQLIEYI